MSFMLISLMKDACQLFLCNKSIIRYNYDRKTVYYSMETKAEMVEVDYAKEEEAI